jgi:lactoylglutathione lyase
MGINHTINFSFDHYTIEVSDLEKSLFFYHKILGFPLLQRPAFDFEGAWLDISNGQALHLIMGDNQLEVRSSSRQLHFAFRHHHLIELRSYLAQFESIEIMPLKVRPDGIQQLFVKDPDGYFIEFCEK